MVAASQSFCVRQVCYCHTYLYFAPGFYGFLIGALVGLTLAYLKEGLCKQAGSTALFGGSATNALLTWCIIITNLSDLAHVSTPNVFRLIWRGNVLAYAVPLFLSSILLAVWGAYLLWRDAETTSYTEHGHKWHF